MCLEGENDGSRRQTHVHIRLSCSAERQVDAEGEADDPDSIGADLRVVLEQVER